MWKKAEEERVTESSTWSRRSGCTSVGLSQSRGERDSFYDGQRGICVRGGCKGKKGLQSYSREPCIAYLTSFIIQTALGKFIRCGEIPAQMS